MNSQSVVLITGASSGIGRALALHYARQHCRVIVTARRETLLIELAAAIRAAGGEALPLVCDVSDAVQVNAAITQAHAAWGRLNLAILNAGVSEPTDALHFEAASLVRMTQTNLFGVAYGLEALIPLMRQQANGGQIAVVSSLVGDRGMPGSAGYSTTKNAVNALCDGLRAHLKTHGIQLVTIAPGYVHTEMTARFKNMPFVMSAEAAADLIARRLAHRSSIRSSIIRFPFWPSLFMRFVRLMPTAIFDALLGKRRSPHEREK